MRSTCRAPTHTSFQGNHYLLVPDVSDITPPGVSTSSRIAIASSTNLFGGFTFQGTYPINGYASDPAIFFRPQGGLEPAPTPFLVYADGDGENCGGLSIAQLSRDNITTMATTPQAITIDGLADVFGTTGKGCPAKGRPYLEGASLYWFTTAETGSANVGLGGDYYLVFAVKPEGGSHGKSQEVIAYATSSSATGPYTYRGVIMEASSSEWTNQASIQKYGDHYMFAYHDGTPTNDLPARKVRGACLTFQRGRINPIQRTTDGFARCQAISGTIALRSVGNGNVVVAAPTGVAPLQARAHTSVAGKSSTSLRAMADGSRCGRSPTASTSRPMTPRTSCGPTRSTSAGRASSRSSSTPMEVSACATRPEFWLKWRAPPPNWWASGSRSSFPSTGPSWTSSSSVAAGSGCGRWPTVGS